MYSFRGLDEYCRMVCEREGLGSYPVSLVNVRVREAMAARLLIDPKFVNQII